MTTYGPLTFAFDDRSMWSVSNVLRYRASERPDKTYLKWESQSWTYREVDEIATSIGSSLLGAGLVKGDRMMIFMDNCAEYVLSWFGAARAGIVETPTNSDYLGRFLQHSLTVTAPKAIVVQTHYVSRFVDLGDALRVLDPLLIIVGDDAETTAAGLVDTGLRAVTFDDMRRPVELLDLSEPDRREELASLLFTSGTTGPSKAVMMSNAHMFFFANEY
ncbi:MAG: class I adenylate-forming enzyme family protein, partial [Ilumatobacteraceae bacterium]